MLYHCFASFKQSPLDFNIYVQRYNFRVFSVARLCRSINQVRWKNIALISCFLSNISAKYENLTMLSRVIAKNIGDVF